MTKDEKLKIAPEFDRALTLWHDGDSQQAIEILKKLDVEFPNQPSILGMIGSIYKILGDLTNALVYFERTVKLSPESELASRALFLVLWQHERFDDAFKESQRFIKLRGLTEEYAFIFNEIDENDFFAKHFSQFAE